MFERNQGNIKNVQISFEHADRDGPYSGLANFNLKGMLESSVVHMKDLSSDERYDLGILASANNKSLLFDLVNKENEDKNISFVIDVFQLGQEDVYAYIAATSYSYANEKEAKRLHIVLSERMKTLLGERGLVFSSDNIAQYSAEKFVEIITDEVRAAMPPRPVSKMNPIGPPPEPVEVSCEKCRPSQLQLPELVSV